MKEHTSTTNDGRGRTAETTAHMSSQGWKDIMLRSWRDIGTRNLGIVSAGVAFYSLLAIFPGLAAMVSLYGLIADPSDVQSLVDLSGRVIPGNANKLIADQMTTLINKPSSGLTFGAIIGIMFALWSSHSGMTTLMTALNIAYGETERRGYVRRNLLALGLTLGAIVLLIVALSMVALLPAIIGFLPLPEEAKTLLSLMRWPILIVLVMLALGVLYRLGPSRQQPKWQWISLGAIVTTIMWIGGSAAFSYYVSKFSSYDKTYGSLGAVIVLLMWFYITGYLILIGAEINAEMEHSASKPLGERDVEMADTLGAAAGSPKANA